MAVFMQLLANSLIIGSIYALVAAGFSLIYSTNRFMHFAHGSSVVASAYILWALYSQAHLPFVWAVILTVICTAVLGLLMFKIIYRPLQKRKSSNVILLIASVGILILVENLILLFAGADVKTVAYIHVQRGLDILGATITPLQLVIVAVALVVFVALWLFMRKTKMGRNLRAVADNKELARIVGIDDVRVQTVSFILGSVLAAIAGILIALEQSLEPTMGTQLIVKGFTGSVIGGVSSVPGSLLGSYILGLAENFGIWYLPSGYKDAIAFVLLFVFLLWRPKGLVGGAKK